MTKIGSAHPGGSTSPDRRSCRTPDRRVRTGAAASGARRRDVPLLLQRLTALSIGEDGREVEVPPATIEPGARLRPLRRAPALPVEPAPCHFTGTGLWTDAEIHE